jgi:hypothetical protein
LGWASGPRRWCCPPSSSSELASYRFEPPAGHTHAEVLLEAHRIRVQRDGYNIGQVHLADAIEALVARSQDSLSADRSPADPYTRQPA